MPVQIIIRQQINRASSCALRAWDQLRGRLLLADSIRPPSRPTHCPTSHLQKAEA